MVYRGLYSYRQGVRVITVFPNIVFVLFLYVERFCKSFFLLCITNLEELVQTILSLLFWSVSECRVPLFNQLIQLLA